MKLIERYLNEIGRYLPGNKRADILAELRSVLEDSLEAKAGPEPSEGEIAEVIREMGAPAKVAAAYHPASQYLIGPELFPLFKLVLGIVLLTSIGGQLIATVVSVMFGDGQVRILEMLLGLLNSIPVTLGIVTLVFYLLQRFEVNPDFKEEAFDPYKLPKFEDEEPVNRVEQVVGIVMGVLFFIVLAWFADQGAFGWSRVNGVFENPVLERYFFWIGLSITAGIVLSIILLWRGRWQTSTRIANVGINLFSLVVLFQLIQGHREWLRAAGYSGNFMVINELTEIIGEGTQLIGMLGTQIALTVAAIIVLIDTVVFVARLITRANRRARVMDYRLPAK